MPFIKLHGQGINEGETLFVNPVQIECINADVGAVNFPDGSVFWTKETPEEILRMIKEANIDKQDDLAIEAWNRRATDSKSSIDFDKIATSFHPGQIEECALLYLWFYNNVSVNWLADVKRNNGRGMYRKFAEAISNRILEK